MDHHAITREQLEAELGPVASRAFFALNSPRPTPSPDEAGVVRLKELGLAYEDERPLDGPTVLRWPALTREALKLRMWLYGSR
jgi:hypothetical protein